MTKDLITNENAWWEEDRNFEEVDKSQLSQASMMVGILCPKCRDRNGAMFSGEFQGHFVAQISCPKCELTYRHKEEIGKRAIRDRMERSRFEQKAIYCFSEYVEGLPNTKRTLIGK